MGKLHHPELPCAAHPMAHWHTVFICFLGQHSIVTEQDVLSIKSTDAHQAKSSMTL